MALSKADLKSIRELVEIVLDFKLDEKLEEKLDEKLAHIPNKNEFFEQMDRIMGELKDIREELTVLSGHSSEHSDRIETLEKIHPNYSHTAI
jgi:predicted nuclease with TOPRIM domain